MRGLSLFPSLVLWLVGTCLATPFAKQFLFDNGTVESAERARVEKVLLSLEH